MKSMFSRLVSYNNLILLEMVDIIGSSNAWVSSEELANKLSLSLRTIQRYTSHLEALIFRYRVKREITLESHRGKGIRFSENGESNRLFLKEYIYQEDETVKLLQSLLISNVESKKSYCKKNNISLYSTSFNESINKINLVLDDYNLSLDESLMEIQGDETQIRRFAYVFFWNLYKLEERPNFSARVSLSKVESSLEEFILENNFMINAIIKKEIVFSIMISLMRYDMEKYVSFKDEWNDYIPHNELPILTESVTKIFHKHSINSKDEINFFILCMLTRPYTYAPPNIRGKLIRYIRKDTNVYRATNIAFHTFSRKIHEITPEKYEESLIFIHRSHLSAHLFKFEGNDSNGSVYYDTFFLEDVFPYFLEFVDELFETSQNSIFLSKDYLAKRYYVLASYFDHSLIMGPKVEVLLESDLPFMYETVIKNVIADRFSYKFNISFLTNNYLKIPDVIISTVAYANGNAKRNNNVVYIDSLLAQQDFERIESAIRKASLEKIVVNKTSR